VKNSNQIKLPEQLPAGSETYVIGTPADEQFVNSVSKGIVSGIRKLDDFDYIQTDAVSVRGAVVVRCLTKMGRLSGLPVGKLSLRVLKG
jgi:S1-C subfamily serine protease